MVLMSWASPPCQERARPSRWRTVMWLRRQSQNRSSADVARLSRTKRATCGWRVLGSRHTGTAGAGLAPGWGLAIGVWNLVFSVWGLGLGAWGEALITREGTHSSIGAGAGT